MDLLDVSPTVEVVSHPTGNWPTNKWFCKEWEFQDQPDRITLWVNGTEVGTMDSTNAGSSGSLYQGKSSGIIGGFDTFGVGFHDWHPAKAFDVYSDDVVLDAKRIRLPDAVAARPVDRRSRIQLPAPPVGAVLVACARSAESALSGEMVARFLGRGIPKV